MGLSSLLQDLTGKDKAREAAPEVAFLQVLIANVCFIGKPGGKAARVLVDAGLPDTARLIARASERLFGRESRPAAIIFIVAFYVVAG